MPMKGHRQSKVATKTVTLLKGHSINHQVHMRVSLHEEFYSACENGCINVFCGSGGSFLTFEKITLKMS